LQIDSVSFKDKSINEVFPLLSGKPGTPVSVKFYRPSTNKIVAATLTRESILIPSVPYFGTLPGGFGIIKIIAETEQTINEVKEALAQLTKRSLLKGLVLDLRGNRGGLMSQAIKVGNLFIEKGKVAVTEKSWYAETTNYFEEESWDTKIPLVVLIDNMTASSGEILAGALQDQDRAVLIGQKSYGKGMVQRLYDLPDGEMLKLTTAYYYTPGGRCIQRKEKGGERTKDWTDTLKKMAHTVNGRTVISFDGILPDIAIPRTPEPLVIQDLRYWGNPHLFRFANQYFISHPTISSASEFRITNTDYDSFIAFLKKEKLPMTIPAEKELNELAKALETEISGKETAGQIALLRETLNKEKDKQFILYKKQIKSLLESAIAAQYYYSSGGEENKIKDDEEVKKAVEVLSNWEKYKTLLQAEK
jgi:carboxyl-terminal processing protease